MFLDNVHNTNKNFENLDDAAGDFHFLCPLVDFANTYALEQQSVFFYYYTQRSSKHHWPEWLGVMHGDEISFVFGEPLYPFMNFTKEERILARKILKYWSNFARYSDPNGPSQEVKLQVNIPSNKSLVKPSKPGRYYVDHSHSTPTLNQYIEPWPKYRIVPSPDNDFQRAYLILNSEKIDVSYNLRAEYCTFWGSFLPTLILSECKYKLLKLVDKSFKVQFSHRFC